MHSDSLNNLSIATAYINIGTIYHRLGNYFKAS